MKATTLCSSNKQWDDFDSEQLKSVIFGLLRQNSFTFLEALEDARFAFTIVDETKYLDSPLFLRTSSTSAIKTTLREVVMSVTKPATASEGGAEAAAPTTLTSLVGDFARSASTEEWIDLFDVLVGSLVVLLYRIHTVHCVIAAAIGEVNASSGGEEKGPSSTDIQQSQLDALKVNQLTSICTSTFTASF